ncbi:MAG: ABC transporter ATP-binding protein [Kordiimonas sp.]
MTVLRLENVKRSYHQAHKDVHVLKGIDLNVEAGELVALIGSSGSGKSTLLQIAGLLDSEYEGLVQIDGETVSGLKDDARSALRRQKLGFIYQFHHLLPDFTAAENVAMALSLNGFNKTEAMKKSAEVLDQLGLSERLDHVPSKLSGGEQQRVAIARAIVAEPALLLADEPTGNLDEETAARVLELFLQTVRDRKLAAVIATHDKSLAAKLDRQLVLQDGQLHQL